MLFVWLLRLACRLCHEHGSIEAMTKSEAVAIARADGWSIGKYGELCSKCVAESRARREYVKRVTA